MLTFSQLRYYKPSQKLGPSFFIQHDGDLSNARVMECAPDSYLAEMERSRSDGHQIITIPFIRSRDRAEHELKLLIAQQRTQSSAAFN